jgi:hypothetical protein
MRASLSPVVLRQATRDVSGGVNLCQKLGFIKIDWHVNTDLL